ncbi:MAG: helix-turn-helix domain-containing protein [Candidatus Eisenbacteria bacterium]
MRNQLTKSEFVALAEFRAALRRFLRVVDAGAREAGVTPQQHQMLLAIMGRPAREWATVGELAEALQVRHHTAVGLVDRCVQLGLVRRKISADDRRRVEVWLSAKGARILARVSAGNRRELEGLRALLGEIAPAE